MKALNPKDPEILIICDKLTYYIDGTPLLEKNATNEQIKVFDKIKNTLKYESQYKLLHSCFPNYLNIKNKPYFYYIPKDILKYIKYKNNKILIKKTLPDYLKEKVDICKTIMEIDFNYFFKIKKVSCLNGKKIGIKNQWNKKTPIIIFVQSRKKLGLFYDYEYMKNLDYIKYNRHGYLTEHGKVYIGDDYIK